MDTTQNKLTDADYVTTTLKPAALRYVQSAATPANETSLAKIVAILDAATADQWMAAYKAVGLVGQHLVQEIVKLNRKG